MPRTKVWIVFALAVLCTGLACVIRTEHKIEAHIVLDIRHIQTQADQFYNVISGEEELSALDVATTETALMLDSRPESRLRAAGSALARLFDASSSAAAATVAQRDQTDIDATPAQKEILARMKARFQNLQKHKSSGCIGEKNDGYVVYRECEECKKDAAVKKTVDALIKAENDDRKALYNSILEQEKGPAEALAAIQLVWAEKWRKEAKSGFWLQMPDSLADVRKFLRTEPGKKIEAQNKDVKAREWHRVP